MATSSTTRRKTRRNGSRKKIAVTARSRSSKHSTKASRPSAPPGIHKARSGWFQGRAAWPRREADIGNIVRERHRATSTLPAVASASNWKLAGPTNIGGRITSIVCDPHDADHIWIGAAGGGVWASDDAGNSWSTVWHQEASLNIGALAIDLNDTNTLYAATGEANLSADSYPGVGLYVTRDRGKSWQVLADAEKANLPSRIGSIAVDPFDSDRLALGGIGYDIHSETGLYLSNDRALSWDLVPSTGGGRRWCHAVLFDPVNQGVMYAACTEQGSGSGLYKSVDGGVSWTLLTNGLPPAHEIHRASIAVAPSDPHILYAQLADAKTKGSSVLGVFRSNNGGVTWQDISGSEFSQERQMSYNNTIAIHPTDPNRVICGGVDLHLTLDGGQNWYQVTHWYEARGNPHYAHADHHALLWTTAAPDRIYSANDGGIDVSDDSGRSWFNRSEGLSVTMYYDLDVSQMSEKLFGGGAQDNGTPITATGSADDHFDVTGGDGGWIVFDPNDVNHIYASVYNMNIFRFRETDGWEDVTPRGNTEAEESKLSKERDSMWMVNMAMDPYNGDVVYTGTQRVWKTVDDGENWYPVSPVLDGSAITAIDISRADSTVVYVGTEDGGFFRSRNNGYSWAGSLTGGVLPGRTITHIVSHPTNADIVLATVASVGNRHVFRSDDGGDTWVDIDQGQLPDAPFHSIAIPSTKPRTVFSCGDAGVYMSTDLGKNWKNLTGNLPSTMMVDLVYQEQAETLTVATYGRSTWTLKL